MADRTVRVVVRADTAGFQAGMLGASRSMGTIQSGANMAVGQLKSLGAILAGGAVLGGLAAIVSAGNQYTTSVEKWGVITGATRGQMEQMRATAKALGNDMDLPKATAADAAEAMLELSKSGFSVQDSMTSARDTIVLATAAEVEIGEAALMASDMMQSFGLSAEQTARVTDVLTNAANASSISLVDVYNSMKYVGPIAKTMGISIEDASTAIAGMGNAGIKGEMAGTQLRASLTRMAKPTRQAQQAIDALNLSLWDQEGRFKGLRPMVEQLADAKKRMTDQEFQAAVAAAFGMEAQAGIIALVDQGIGTWDKNAAKIREQGSALELARANTKGLGGAMAGLQSQLAAAGIAIYEAIAPALEKITRGTSQFVNDNLPGLISGFGKARDAVAGFAPILSTILAPLAPLLSLLGAIGSAFAGLSGPMMATALALGAIVAMRARVKGLQNSVTGLGQSFMAAYRSQTILNDGTRIQATQLGVLGRTIQGVGAHVPVIRQMQSAFLNAATGADRFSRTAGTAAAAGAGLRAAGSGIVGLFGGPLGVALTGVTLAAGLWADANQRAKQAAAEHKAQVTALSEELNANNGALTRATAAKLALAAADERVHGASTTLGDVLKDQGVTMDTLTTAYQQGSGGLERLAGQLRTAQKAAQEKQQALINDGKATSDAADAAETSAAKYGLAAGALERQAEKARESEARNRDLSRALKESRTGAEEAMGAADAWNDALKTLNDTTATAEQKANALSDAWLLLSGWTAQGEQATDNYNSTMRKLAEQTEENRASLDAASQSNSTWSQSVLDAGGKLSTATKEGEELKKSLIGLHRSAMGAAQATESMGERMEIMADARERAIALGESMGLTKEAATAVADAMGLIPSEVESRFRLTGGTDAERELGGILTQMRSVPDGKEIQITAPTEPVREALELLGLKITELPNGRFKVEAATEDAMAKLREMNETELVDKIQKLLGDDSDVKAKQSNADGWQPLDKIQGLFGEASDLVGKQADAQAWQAEKKTQVIDGDNSGAVSAIQNVRGMGIADKVFNIVANISSAARAALGFAEGGIVGGGPMSGAAAGREQHQAQFGYGTRTWAEPETGGEAYIPLSPQKRGRSKALAEEVVNRFGGQVAWGATVRQSAGPGVTRAQMRDMFAGLEKELRSAASAPARSGAAVQIGAYYQQAGASANQVAHELEWLARGRGR